MPHRQNSTQSFSMSGLLMLAVVGLVTGCGGDPLGGQLADALFGTEYAPTGPIFTADLEELTGAGSELASLALLGQEDLLEPFGIDPLDSPGSITGGLTSADGTLEFGGFIGSSVRVVMGEHSYLFDVFDIVDFENQRMVPGAFVIEAADGLASCNLEGTGCGQCNAARFIVGEDGESRTLGANEHTWSYCLP